MTDTIIKGSGNSRTIKSVPNLAALAPTYDKLLELLTGQGLPVDIGALNPSGCVQIGNDLNKETLLKDATAALYGKNAAATPDQIFSKIAPDLANALRKGNVEHGTYIRPGPGAADTTRTINFSFTPQVVILASQSYNPKTFHICVSPIKTAIYILNQSTIDDKMSIYALVDKLTWKTNSLDITYYEYPATYHYTAIG